VPNIALRDLRNDTSTVLRRVEAGERFVVTVDRRPVAALVPLERRSSWVAGHEVWSRIAGSQADVGLGPALDRLLPDGVADL
jgi:prevent-host-death family protein